MATVEHQDATLDGEGKGKQQRAEEIWRCGLPPSRGSPLGNDTLCFSGSFWQSFSDPQEHTRQTGFNGRLG